MVKNIKLLLVIAILLVIPSKVSAKMLTAKDVSSALNSSSEVKEMRDQGLDIVSKVNESTKKLGVYAGSDLIIELSYTDEYLEYNNRGVTVSKDNVDIDANTETFINLIIIKILELSGYTADDLPQKDFNDYNTQGLELSIIPYTFSVSADDPQGCIDYFKMTLNTDHVKSIVNGSNINTSSNTSNTSNSSNDTITTGETPSSGNTVSENPQTGTASKGIALAIITITSLLFLLFETRLLFASKQY